MAKVKPIPDGYPQVSPYLAVDGARNAIEFYSNVFGATERMHLPDPSGRIGHADRDGKRATGRRLRARRRQRGVAVVAQRRGMDERSLHRAGCRG